MFRSLTYFRQQEDAERGDPYEGTHKDHPGTDITLESLDGRVKSVGKFAFLNTLNSDLVYVFCLSNRLDKKLMSDFGADACIEITDVDAFQSRIRRAVMSSLKVNRKVGVLAGQVSYYDPATPTREDIQDVKKLPFFKRKEYEKQAEYRLCFGHKKGSFELIQQITQPHHNPYDEVAGKLTIDWPISVGPISDIARRVDPI